MAIILQGRAISCNFHVKHARIQKDFSEGVTLFLSQREDPNTTNGASLACQ